MSLKLFFAALALPALLLLGCKGKQGDPGPQGSAYNPNTFSGVMEGYIKGTLSGKTADSIPYSYNLDWEGNVDSVSNYYQVESFSNGGAIINQALINISKTYSGQGTPFYGTTTTTYSGQAAPFSYYTPPITNTINFQFTVPNINSINKDTIITAPCTFSFIKDLGNGVFNSETITFLNQLGVKDAYNMATITNIVYNPSTRIIAGNFSAIFQGYNSIIMAPYGPITISGGTFSTYLYSYVQ